MRLGNCDDLRLLQLVTTVELSGSERADERGKSGGKRAWKPMG
jgi:hypothetical protein